jgi:hypothetical protein
MVVFDPDANPCVYKFAFNMCWVCAVDRHLLVLRCVVGRSGGYF